jgi:hypothetical protein
MLKLVLLVSFIFSQSIFAQNQMNGLTGKAMAMGKEKAAEVMVACKNDTVQFCEKMKTADTVKACLTENYSKLSDGCKKVIMPKK